MRQKMNSTENFRLFEFATCQWDYLMFIFFLYVAPSEDQTHYLAVSQPEKNSLTITSCGGLI